MTIKHMIKRILILHFIAFSLLIASCAIPMNEEASHIKQVTVAQSHILDYECEFLAEVTGSSSAFSRDTAHNNALNELLDNAAKLKATHVFINKGNFKDLRGAAYYCAYCKLADGKADTNKCVDTNSDKIDLPDRPTCEKKGYIWYLKALNEKTCEKRGGSWLPDRDILRILPFAPPAANQRK